MKNKYLPLDVSTFETMISGNYLYVDKTEYIYNLFARGGRYFFLSRPRRFGKSLLISTLKELFLGNKKLFEGLWIYKSDFEWQEHPVIHLDFSIIDHETVQELKISLAWKLKTIAQKYGINIDWPPTLGSMLEQLVVELSKKNKVVILIDEYDKPILDHLHSIERAKKQRAVLKSFYDAIKGLDPYLKVVFLTGVSRFSKTSLFSGINNLNDLTLKPEAAAVLGYTQEEIQENFKPYLEALAQKNNVSTQVILQELQRWYNGYRFSKIPQMVYNPFSVLYCLHDKEFYNYWFESGTPSFLIHLLRQHYTYLEKINQTEIDQDSLGNFDLENIPLVPLLFQTGYLTIKDYDEKTGKLKINFPDREVELSFTRFLVTSLAHTSRIVLDTLGLQLVDALRNNDITQFCAVLQTLFAHVPYTIDKEDYYHALFQFLLSLLSLEAQSEFLTNKGRIDMVVSTKTHDYLFELKINSSPEIALKQIKDRGYYERFLHKERAVVLVGLAFNQVKKKMHIDFVQEAL